MRPVWVWGGGILWGLGMAFGATSPRASCRQKIVKEKAVPMVEGYMFEEHEMIRLAATECMCNLALSPQVSS